MYNDLKKTPVYPNEKLESLIQSFQNYLKSIGKSQATCKSYAVDIRNFEAKLINYHQTFSEVDKGSLEFYLKDLKAANYSNNSIRRQTIAIRQFFRYLEQRDASFESPFDDFVIPQYEEKGTGGVSADLIEKLLKFCEIGKNRLKNSRDQLIIILMAYEGVRASELIQIKWHDLQLMSDKISLRIKSEKKRILKISPFTYEKILEYEKELKLQIEVSEDLAMIIGFKGRSFQIMPSVSRHGIKFMLNELKEMLQLKQLNSENLRHFAMDYQLSLGKAPEQIMEHLGLKRIGNIAKHLPREYE